MFDKQKFEIVQPFIFNGFFNFHNEFTFFQKNSIHGNIFLIELFEKKNYTNFKVFNLNLFKYLKQH